MTSRSSRANQSPRLPSYCLHRPSGQAFVKVAGKFIYLGPYDSPASREAYGIVLADLLAGRPVSRPDLRGDADKPVISVRDVGERFKRHAREYYVKAGKPTAEAGMVANACDHAIALFGDQPAGSFGPLALKAVRERMVASGLARSTTNQAINRIRRAFKWAASEELIPADVPAALATVTGLRAGRTDARETEPIRPVSHDDVEATLVELSEVVGDMVRLQRLTAMRPGELCDLRPCDIDRSEKVWTYRPESHKTQHRGCDRVVFIGPKAQAVLAGYLDRDSKAYCFQPSESEAKRRRLAHAMRKTPLSCGNRPGRNRRDEPANQLGDQYRVASYRQAIARACRRVGIEPWKPNQLRHTAATEVRQRFGLESTQVLLGHSTARTSEIYAERNMAAGADVAQEIG